MSLTQQDRCEYLAALMRGASKAVLELHARGHHDFALIGAILSVAITATAHEEPTAAISDSFRKLYEFLTPSLGVEGALELTETVTEILQAELKAAG